MDSLVESLLEGELTFTEAVKFERNAFDFTLSFDREFGGANVSSKLSKSCGTLRDFEQAIATFKRKAVKFLRSQGLKPEGDVQLCQDRLVLNYSGVPTGQGPKRNRPTSDRPIFTQADRERAEKIRQATATPLRSRRSLMQKVLRR